jgi:hypothetical protein
VNMTLEDWTTLGLDPRELVVWNLAPAVVQARVVAIKSVILSERWTVAYPDQSDHRHYVILGYRFSATRAHDIADVLAGRVPLAPENFLPSPQPLYTVSV